MIKEYWLIRYIKTIGHKNPFQIVDKLNAKGVRTAEQNFKKRNNFKKLLVKSDLIIVHSERWF